MVKYLSEMLNMGVNQQYYKNYDECFASMNCKITLNNGELWKKFHSLGTEMIITKSGRRMFPSLHVQVADLSPNALYCVLLEMTPSSHNRFKYSSSGGWFPTGTKEAQSPHRVYLHPDSPARGDYWMSQPISFGRLKLTNTINPPSGQVVLSSMHKYQPKIIIAKALDPREIAWAPATCVVFPETQFIAVTAYQNEKITKLKIDNNPFAKGFRETGQAKCKRKKIDNEDDMQVREIKKAKLESSLSTNVEKDRLSLSPVCSESNLKPHSEDRLSTSSMSPLSSLEVFTKTSLFSHQNLHSYEKNNPLYARPYFYTFPAYPARFWSNNFYSQMSCSSEYSQTNRCFSVKKQCDKPRKLTDFSIRAITGCK